MTPPPAHFLTEPAPSPQGTAAVARDVRLPEVIGAPKDLSRRIGELRVAVVGTGSVGGPAAVQLSRLQPASLFLIDPKPFKTESVLTQTTMGPEAAGCPKAAHLARQCKAASPGTEVRYFPGPVGDLDIGELAGKIDALLLATDNIPAEIEVAQLALRFDWPVIHGAVHGETTLTQVRVYDPRLPDAACPACALGSEERRQMNGQVFFSCDPGGEREVRTVPTRCFPNLGPIAGGMMVMQLLKLLVPFGSPVSGTLLEFCGHTGRSTTVPLTRNPDCPCEHRPWNVRHYGDDLSGSSPGSLLRFLALPPDGADLFRVGRHDWFDRARCPSGHVAEGSGRFHPSDSPPPLPEHCPGCGQSFAWNPLGRKDAVSPATLGAGLDRRLRELGVISAPWIRIQHGNSETLILPPHHS